MESHRERFNIRWILDCTTTTSTSGDTITCNRHTEESRDYKNQDIKWELRTLIFGIWDGNRDELSFQEAITTLKDVFFFKQSMINIWRTKTVMIPPSIIHNIYLSCGGSLGTGANPSWHSARGHRSSQGWHTATNSHSPSQSNLRGIVCAVGGSWSTRS